MISQNEAGGSFSKSKLHTRIPSYLHFTSVKTFSVNMLISISPFCVRVFVYVIHLANLRVYSTCCADIETLQLLDELLLNFGWFPDESPQHKQ